MLKSGVYVNTSTQNKKNFVKIKTKVYNLVIISI